MNLRLNIIFRRTLSGYDEKSAPCRQMRAWGCGLERLTKIVFNTNTKSNTASLMRYLCSCSLNIFHLVGVHVYAAWYVSACDYYYFYPMVFCIINELNRFWSPLNRE